MLSSWTKSKQEKTNFFKESIENILVIIEKYDQLSDHSRLETLANLFARKN